MGGPHFQKNLTKVFIHIVVHSEQFYSEELYNSAYGNVKGFTGFWQFPLFSFSISVFFPLRLALLYL